MHLAQVAVLLTCGLASPAAARHASGAGVENVARAVPGSGSQSGSQAGSQSRVWYSIRCGRELTRTFPAVCYTPTARCDGENYVNPLYMEQCRACTCEKQLKRPDVGNNQGSYARKRNRATAVSPAVTPAPDMRSKREPSPEKHKGKKKKKTTTKTTQTKTTKTTQTKTKTTAKPTPPPAPTQKPAPHVYDDEDDGDVYKRLNKDFEVERRDPSANKKTKTVRFVVRSPQTDKGEPITPTTMTTAMSTAMSTPQPTSTQGHTTASFRDWDDDEEFKKRSPETMEKRDPSANKKTKTVRFVVRSPRTDASEPTNTPSV
ncbi:hypothetical protein PLICBS_003342 [Purpureocillium lilacinum]|uniref:uncharacterized protein n=1 Tax=Purpureocillium lilacinum TaxID=33203 RepID=UPI002080A7B8|nr:hypothetical protein PLICBS_003342 [Purpureocillium lilacinum]